MPRPGVGNPGNRGNPYGNSRRAPEMADFYRRLDAACLDSVDYLVTILQKAKEKGLDNSEWRKDGINAAKALIQKAPERVSGDGGGPLIIKWQE